jgi:hypothetical protein
MGMATQQSLAFSPSNPSFAMIGTIVNAAVGYATSNLHQDVKRRRPVVSKAFERFRYRLRTFRNTRIAAHLARLNVC